MLLTASAKELASASTMLKSSSPCVLVFLLQPNQSLRHSAVGAFRKIVSLKFIILVPSPGAFNGFYNWTLVGPDVDTVVVQIPSTDRVLISYS